MFKRKYNLVITELYNKKFHGFDHKSDPNVLGHYLIIYSYYTNNNIIINYFSDTHDYDYNFEEYLNIYKKKYKFIKKYSEKYNVILHHPIIRNYHKIITNQNYIQPQIAEKIYLAGDECVAIFKTFWLKIVQRCWKRVYKERKNILDKILRNPILLINSQSNPKWNIKIPSIYGMFWNFIT